jgi:hypothetical protein
MITAGPPPLPLVLGIAEDLKLARQVLYHLSHTSSPVVSIFKKAGTKLYCAQALQLTIIIVPLKRLGQTKSDSDLLSVCLKLLVGVELGFKKTSSTWVWLLPPLLCFQRWSRQCLALG